MINGVTLNDGIAQGDPVYHEPDNIYSLTDAWKSMKPRPLGIMDQLVGELFFSFIIHHLEVIKFMLIIFCSLSLSLFLYLFLDSEFW